MKTDQLKDWAQRKPFRPFTVNLLSGEDILVDTPEAIIFPPRSRYNLIIVFTEDGRMRLFEESVIASLAEGSTAS